MRGGARWNHNIHYHRLVLDQIPPNCRTALDVGCGQGLLAQELRERVPEVTGIDRDPASIDLARHEDPEHTITWLCDDVMTHEFPLGSFDLVASVAVLHHLDEAAALERMAALLSPGGRLVVIGVAEADLPRDAFWDVAGFFAHRWHRLLRGGVWEHSAPVTDPSIGPREVRAIAERALPGVRYRRHLLWRYSLTWDRT